jgi:hypothetical protein
MADKPIAAGNSKESAEQSTTAAKIQGFLNSGMSIPLVAIIVGFISVCVAWARSKHTIFYHKIGYRAFGPSSILPISVSFAFEHVLSWK